MNPFTIDGQRAWYHDEGDESGYFHTYDALVLDRERTRKIHVFLPRDYETSDRAYPVVYLNDGQTIFWPEGLSPYSWNVPKTLSDLYRQQAIQPPIIVAVRSLNRSHEYLHVKEFCAPFQREGGGLAEYANYLVQLKQFIDRAYRTLSSNKSTTICGSSHGGLAAFYIGCVCGKHFGKVGALSPSFWAGGGFDLRATPLMATVDRYLRPDNLDRPQLWIDWGSNRLGGFHNWFIEARAAKWSQKMVALLQGDYGYSLGRDLWQHEDPIGTHDERAWAYRFGLLLRQYYPGG